MKHFNKVTILALLATVTMLPTLAQAKRYVLSVGVVQSRDTLRYTLNDAILVKEMLSQDDSEVVVLTSDGKGQGMPTKDNIYKTLRDMIGKAGSEDTVWFYYSGHGSTDGNESILCTYGYLENPRTEYISANALRKEIDSKSHCKGFVMVLDACHSGSLKALPGLPLSQVFAPIKGISTWASCEIGETSLELPELKHGLFTYVFARGIAGAAAGKDTTVTLSDLKNYVTKTTADWAKKFAQHPQNPVITFTEGSGSTPVGQTNDDALTQVPEPTPDQQVARPTEPLPPGVIVTFEAAGSTTAESTEDVETVFRQQLLEGNYPVVSSEQATDMLTVLRNRDSAQAAQQAQRMFCRFLLRGKVTVKTRSTTVGKRTVFVAAVTINGQVVDSDGSVLVSLNTDSGEGVPVEGQGFSEDRAIKVGVRKAAEAAVKIAMPAMDKVVRPRLTQGGKTAEILKFEQMIGL
ncbi:MAG: caspase family protein [Armatimonadetes bacterium]|nr:caspase family protein [Armatimonadota bacterium]